MPLWLPRYSSILPSNSRPFRFALRRRSSRRFHHHLARFLLAFPIPGRPLRLLLCRRLLLGPLVSDMRWLRRGHLANHLLPPRRRLRQRLLLLLRLLLLRRR